jgi:hypothetical protein
MHEVKRKLKREALSRLTQITLRQRGYLVQSIHQGLPADVQVARARAEIAVDR